MNKKIIGTLISILLIGIGIASAGLIPCLSNKVSTSVEVKGPIFYLDGKHEDGGVWHKLLINELPIKEDIYFWDGNRIVFKTKPLGINNFYKARFNATVYIKSNNSGNTIQARFIKLNDDNNDQLICNVNELITIKKGIIKAENFFCDSNEEIDLSDYDRIGLELRGNGNESQEYWIRVGDNDLTYGASRIEVTAV